MFNAIEEVKRQYTYAVQPVKLFETRNSQAAQKSSFDFINQMQNQGIIRFTLIFQTPQKETNLT